jgi:AmiR/NasT family two-component response regulator
LPDSTDWRQTYDAVIPYAGHLPVIVMTSNKSPEVITELLKQGTQDYIVKGSKKHDTDMLKETVEFAMLRHKVVDKLSAKIAEKDQCMHWLSGGYSM